MCFLPASQPAFPGWGVSVVDLHIGQTVWEYIPLECSRVWFTCKPNEMSSLKPQSCMMRNIQRHEKLVVSHVVVQYSVQRVGVSECVCEALSRLAGRCSL